MDPLNFIGSKFRLITRANIRYEGILLKIDPDKQTITLGKVKIFGTEDRLTDGFAVPAQEGVFNTIVYDANQIQDLVHLEGSDLPPGFHDPAIVHSKQPTTSPVHPTTPTQTGRPSPKPALRQAISPPGQAADQHKSRVNLEQSFGRISLINEGKVPKWLDDRRRGVRGGYGGQWRRRR